MNNTVLIDTMKFQHFWRGYQTVENDGWYFIDSAELPSSSGISFYSSNKLYIYWLIPSMCGEIDYNYELDYQLKGDTIFISNYSAPVSMMFPSAWKLIWINDHYFKICRLFYLASVYDYFKYSIYQDSLDKYWVSETLDFSDGSSIAPHWKITPENYYLMAEKDTLLAIRHVEDPELTEVEVFSAQDRYKQLLLELTQMPRFADKPGWRLKMPPAVYYSFDRHVIYLECTTTADLPGEKPFYLQLYINPVPLKNVERN